MPEDGCSIVYDRRFGAVCPARRYSQPKKNVEQSTQTQARQGVRGGFLWIGPQAVDRAQKPDFLMRGDRVPPVAS
jgi:hypothetical protein